MRYEYQFNKLFKRMIDQNIKKKELASMANISQSTISRLANGQMVSMDALMAICDVFHCRLEDIMDVIPIEEKESDKL